MDNKELPIGYYLENFQRLIDHAKEHYSDLLSCEERQWLVRFQTLETSSQRLLVRLYTRKGEWFRSDKLVYDEIPGIDEALEILCDEGFLDLNPAINQQQLASTLLTKPEILKLFPGLPRSAAKPELIAQLDEQAIAPVSPFNVVHLKHAQLLETLQLLFFANTHQDHSQFILEDLGLNQFENYQLSKERRFFNHRSQIEALRLYSELSQQHQERYRALDREQKLDAIHHWLELIEQHQIESAQAITPNRYVETKKQALLNTLARELERLGELDSALALFERTTLPPSRERQVRMLLSLEMIEHAEALAESMLDSPFSIEEYEVALRLHDKLERAKGNKVPRRSKPKQNEEHLQLDLSQTRVEMAAAAHYAALGKQVYYSENTFLCGLFGLIFWDAIFAPIEGAFINAYQVQPKDLYSSSFCERRAEFIKEARQQFLADGYKGLQERYKQKNGILNPFVQWAYFPQELIEHAKRHLPKHTLLALCDKLLEDRKAFRAGMPDLISFDDDGLEWIEVKGPGDSLQHNQYRWLAVFKHLGLNAKVCYVNHR